MPKIFWKHTYALKTLKYKKKLWKLLERTFFKTGLTTASFSFIFGLLKKNNTFLQQNKWKIPCPSSIRCQDSNPQPLEHESSPITTRPRMDVIMCPFSSSVHRIITLKVYLSQEAFCNLHGSCIKIETLTPVHKIYFDALRCSKSCPIVSRTFTGNRFVGPRLPRRWSVIQTKRRKKCVWLISFLLHCCLLGRNGWGNFVFLY